jgi:hypothetical protein
LRCLIREVQDHLTVPWRTAAEKDRRGKGTGSWWGREPEAVFADPDTAPISPQLKAALGLVRKLTLAPEEVGADDIRAVLKAGMSEDGVIDVLYVCFASPDRPRGRRTRLRPHGGEGCRQAAQVLLRLGYKLPAPLRLLARNPAGRPRTPEPDRAARQRHGRAGMPGKRSLLRGSSLT